MSAAFPPSATRPPTPDTQYDPTKFKKKTRLRDYVVYGLVLAVVFGAIGACVYYLTRTPGEQQAIRAKFERTREKVPFLAREKPAPNFTLPERQDPTIDPGDLAPSAPATPPPAAAAPAPRPAPPVKSTAYSGAAIGVRPSKNPQAPAPSPEFAHYTATLTLSSVVAGPPVKIMLDGKIRNIGDTIDPGLGVVIVAIDAREKYLTIRDRTGAELLLYY
jgi:hypothetical protein